MADELAAIADESDARATAIETVDVGLEKSDIRAADVAMVWIGSAVVARALPVRGVAAVVPELKDVGT